MKNIARIFASLATVVALLANAPAVLAAGAASLTLSAAPGSVVAGGTFTVSVTENSGATTINLVTAVMSYDASKIQFVGFDDSTSEFDYKGAQSGGAGVVSVKRGLYGGAYTGSHGVVGVVFKMVSGPATVSVVGGTAITNPQDGQNIWDGVSASTSIAMTAASAQPPASTPEMGGGPSNPNTAAPTTPSTTGTSTHQSTTASTPAVTNPAPSQNAQVTPAVAAATQTVRKNTEDQVAETGETSRPTGLARRVIFAGLTGGLAAVAGLAYLFRKRIAGLTKKPVIKPVAAATTPKAVTKKPAAKTKPVSKKK